MLPGGRSSCCYSVADHPCVQVPLFLMEQNFATKNASDSYKLPVPRDCYSTVTVHSTGGRVDNRYGEPSYRTCRSIWRAQKSTVEELLQTALPLILKCLAEIRISKARDLTTQTFNGSFRTSKSMCYFFSLQNNGPYAHLATEKIIARQGFVRGTCNSNY